MAIAPDWGRPADATPAPPPRTDAPGGALEAFCRRHAARIVTAMVVLHAAIFTVCVALKHRYFLYDDIDLGIFVQAFEGVLSGTTWSSIRGMHWLGDHASLILFPLAPFYAAARSPLTPPVLQAVALALGAIPVYRLARRELSSASAALGFAALYLLYPAVGYVALFEFHPEALCIPLLLAAFAAMRASSWRWALAWTALALLGREDVALVVAAMGLYALALRRPGSLAFGLACLLGAAGALGAFFGLIKPALAGGEEAYVGMYRAWGASLPEVLRALAAHPARAAATLFATPGDAADTLLKRQLWVHLMLPLAFLPLASPLALAIALPVLAEHLLSWRAEQHVILHQYTALVIPFLVAAAVLGARRFAGLAAGSRVMGRRPFGLEPVQVLTVLALVAAIAANLLFGPLLGTGAFQARRALEHTLPTGMDRAMRPYREAMLARLPEGGALVAGFELLPRLAHREVHSLHHVLRGRYTFSDKPYPLPTGVVALVADFAEPRILPLVDEGSAARLAALIAANHLAPVAARGDLVLYGRSPHDSVALVRAAGVSAAREPAIGFDGGLELLGVEHAGRARRGATLAIRSAWRRTGRADGVALVQWRLIDEQGRAVHEHVRHLGYAVRPPSTWPEDEAMVEEYGLVLPADLAPGAYTLGLRVAWRRGGRTGLSEVRGARTAPDLTIPFGRVVVGE